MRNWFSRVFRPSRPRTIRNASRRVRLEVELLEDRLSPAVFTVTTTTDALGGGPGNLSLRQAILDANATPGQNVINLPTGTYNLTLTGTSSNGTKGALYIDSNLTLNGNGATINASALGDRAFNLQGPGNSAAIAVALNNLTLTGGSTTGNGGGIYENASSNLSLTNVVVTSNSAANGGGIFVASAGTAPAIVGGTLNISGGTVQNNHATASGGGIYLARNSTVNLTGGLVLSNVAQADGGGIYDVQAALNLAGVTVQSNNATLDGGGIYNKAGSLNFTQDTILDNIAGHSGGGLYTLSNTTSGTLYIANSTFQGNTATNNLGGGIFINVGAFRSASLTNDTIQGNTATSGDGGGIYANIGGNGSLFLTNSTIQGNTASLLGGGMDATVNGTLYVTNDTFQGNNVSGSGGGLVLGGSGGTVAVNNDAIFGNTAANSGGGIIISSGIVLGLYNDTIQGNTATAGLGGGIYATGGGVTFTSDTIDGNVAGKSGGGIYNKTSGGNITLASSLIAANTAPTGKGPDLNGKFTAGNSTKGYNLIGVLDSSATYTKGANDQGATTTALTAAQIGLAPLQNNGGPTFTQALISTSLAIGNAFPSPLNIDQRGFPRSATKPSIGAFEPQSPLGTTANELYVENLYETLLARVADSAASFWVIRLSNGATGSTVIQGIEATTEYRYDLVASLYQQYLHRAVDTGGLTYWTGFLGTGGTIEQVIQNLVGSAEYFALHGGTNSTFVSALYLDILGRPVDSGALTYWTNALNNGTYTAAGLAGVLLGTQEYRGNLVNSYYLNYLGRPADSGGLNYWVGQLNAGVADQVVLAAILGSGEAFGNRS